MKCSRTDKYSEFVAWLTYIICTLYCSIMDSLSLEILDIWPEENQHRQSCLAMTSDWNFYI